LISAHYLVIIGLQCESGLTASRKKREYESDITTQTFFITNTQKYGRLH
jgi:hypothetical protein